jgi:hypothetical protein
VAGNQVTALGVGIVLAFAGAYDVWAAMHWGYPATITAVVREFSVRWPLIPFAAGLLAGHLFTA